jgi:hypothetical protein
MRIDALIGQLLIGVGRYEEGRHRLPPRLSRRTAKEDTSQSFHDYFADFNCAVNP